MTNVTLDIREQLAAFCALRIVLGMVDGESPPAALDSRLEFDMRALIDKLAASELAPRWERG